jgi:formate hydrogenlyase subunit 3/multisubunit Na+/H+ antiporter MnhD subunit
VATLAASPWRGLTLLLLIAGFGLKAGLVPLHVWLPIAHPAAPMPASAVLSGAIVKAGIIGLIRFLPLEGAADWGTALAALGLVTAFYGAALGITQDNPKTVLAYSTVSQMGLAAAVLGMAVAAGDGAALTVAAYYAMHHELAKGALFLAVGVAAAGGGRAALLIGGLVALGFAGLPFSGGAVAKLAIKPALGYGTVGMAATAASVGSALLMMHFLHRLAASAEPATQVPKGMTIPWMALSAASVVAPWILFVTLGLGSLAETLAPAALWAGIWPVLLGGGLFAALRRWGHLLWRPPEGDLIVLGRPLTAALRSAAVHMERIDGALRRWPAAGVSLLALAVALAALMTFGARP